MKIILLYREVCGMPKACSWDNPPKEIPSHLWEKLSTLYNSPADIDLFSGGMAETALEGAHVGATFACIIGQQVGTYITMILIQGYIHYQSLFDSSVPLSSRH